MTEPGAIKLVLDQGVPRDAAGLLRAVGYECIHVGEIGMWAATDEQILAFCASEDATVVTLDADFHTILAVSGRDRPSVVRIRMQGLHGQETARLLEQVIQEFTAQLREGAFVTVKARKTTYHRLPIGRAV